LIDEVLKEQGDLGVYGDLSAGLRELTKDFEIRIIEKGKV